MNEIQNKFSLINKSYRINFFTQIVQMATRQAQYLQIKQRLDSYNISTTFPLQVMPLLQILLKRLDQQSTASNNTSHQRIKNSLSQVQQLQLTQSIIPKALQHQLSHQTKQNNDLHSQVMTLKQQVQSLEHYIDKHLIQKSDNKEDVRRVLAFRKDKQDELVEELRRVKFMYNELIDFVHDNDGLEKMYLKKLLRPKRFDVEEGGHGQDNSHQNGQELNSRVTFNNARRSSSRHHQQKQSHTKINNQKLQNSQQSEKIKHLEQKLKNRETQIQRLQALTAYDGINLSKVLVQFTEQMQRKRHTQVHQRVLFLQKQNNQLKTKDKHSKNTSGRYQALKDEMQKCHEIIKQLKEQNKSLKRSMKQSNFNIDKHKKEISREINVFTAQNDQMKVTKYSDQVTIEGLRKKVQFYERELLGHRAIQNEKQKKSAPKSVKIKNLVKKVKAVKQQKQVKKDVQVREKYEDQIRLEKGDKKQVYNNKKATKESAKKNTNKKQIVQIPEQSQQSSVNQNQNTQYKQQNEHSMQPQQMQQNQGQSKHSESQQQQEQSSLSQMRNETLIQQYEETINDLTARCLQQKQQLQTKNNAIKGLEEIANRFIKRDQEHKNQAHQQGVQSLRHQLFKVKRQVETLSALLNESQFQKQELRRQFIQMQQLYKRIPTQQQPNQQNSTQYQQRISQLEELIIQKDKKITDMRENNVQTQDKLLKSLDRIRRLNDQIQTLTQQKQSLVKELQINAVRLQEAAQVLRKQRENNSTTIELSQMQKDEIILLRKNLLLMQNRIEQLQQLVNELKGENQRLSYSRQR